MTSRLLHRVSVGVDHSFAGLEHQVIADARKSLGYRGGSSMIKDRDLGNELRAALNSLGIKPFSPESVSRYQFWMATFVVQNPIYTAFQLAIFPAVMFFGVWWAIAAFKVNALMTGKFYLVAALVALIWSICLWVPASRPRYQWRRRNISDTGAAVPAYALQTAMLLKEAVPNADIYVDTLEKREQESRPMPDPFLVVSYGDCEAYVEVWDEPRFNAKRVK